ncbi:MAG: chemotaxis protein CheX [Acidobacteriia bacterium]|nr:chemotaxis protein CheX [Terriglobia bacterium]
MKLEELLIDSLTRAAAQVFSTMLDVQVRCGSTSTERGLPQANDGVVSFIGLAGAWAGTGSLACSPVMACRICSQMLMTEQTAVNEDVLDAVAELTNMIIGGVKTDLEPHLGQLGLSIPTVIFGRNFKTKGAGGAEWIVTPFFWDEDALLAKVCLTRSEKSLAHATVLDPTCHLDF